MRARQSHCGRPGCKVARAVHHILARACEHFVEPGSKEAHELGRAHLVLVSTPLPAATDEEETVEIDPPTDEQLLADWQLLGRMS